MMNLRCQHRDTDFLIVGGGAAGCWAASAFRELSNARILIAEKANIKRSGCLAAGVNALNAYIGPGKTPQDYVDYARADAEGIVRGDLLLSMAEGLNHTVARLESLGLTILKDEQGRYVTRGWRNVKINGENIKPILAKAAKVRRHVSVLNRVNVFEYIVRDNRIVGAYAIRVDRPVLYVISARAVLCATGGAAGLYKPNNPGFSRHKMWYPPFNTGAGLAMGIRAGAEMTSLEMRFIALRCKGTIAPTGTLAQGVGAKQINALGEVYEDRYGLTTSQRVHGTVMENLEGRGPCYLRTVGIAKDKDEDLLKAYLNMAPGQTLRWLESGQMPSVRNVEIEGTEPYIVGGHTASGYWVSTNRETTVRGLFAAGDAAGGCPQKYVTGALVEAEIAARAALEYMGRDIPPPAADEAEAVKRKLESHFAQKEFAVDELEEAMQAVMDEYAGGIKTFYRYSEDSLAIASEKIRELERLSERISAAGMQELVYILELQERLTLCRSVIAHLAARKETRWHSFAEHADYPDRSAEWDLYVNSRLENDEIRIVLRPLVGEGAVYEH
ncbi:MAG: adenylyl-sulfate reductase subunit alpha [Zoogloeaceae bacterium]|jgi:adenylylsulfate reductase subunit A|nr:adenylyl-sulfate reductase subunit alpha [Zoogloeaceae bacterium]